VPLILVLGLLALAAVVWATAGPTDNRVHAQATGGVAISGVTLNGDTATVTVTNNSDSSVNVDGWFVCNFPAYWPMPAVDIAAGATLTFHAGEGADTATDYFAGGGFGALSGSGPGEVALYSSNSFSSAEAIQSYVGWNGGKNRKGLAQEAGIWGEDDVTAEYSASLSNTFDGTGASAWVVALPGQEPVDEPVDEPEPIAATGYGAELSGGSQVPAVQSDASGSFTIDVNADTGVATWSLWLANVHQITQANLHMGPVDDTGGVIVFLIDPDDPGVSSPTSVHYEGAFDVDDLIGDLAGDWQGFDSALEGGLLYANVHSAANPGGEIRGQLGMIDPAAPSIPVAVSAGSSLLGWFGAPTTSTALIDAYSAISLLWFLDPAVGWSADGSSVPSFLRTEIVINLGTGILIVASANFTLNVPLN